jgi:hypothetical protein
MLGTADNNRYLLALILHSGVIEAVPVLFTSVVQKASKVLFSDLF